MKKIFMCAAAVAMLGLASCSGNKAAEAADSVMDTATAVVNEAVVEEVDSLSPDSAQVTVAEVAEVAEAPAAEAAQN